MTEAAEAPEDFALVEESLDLLKKCRSVFQLFNRGSDSMLTRDLGSALRALGQIPSDQEVEMIASKLEQDEIYDKGYTKISFDDFHRVVQENCERKDDIREMVLDSFKAMDLKASGLVDAAQLSSLLTGSGEALTQAEMKELLQEAGVNKDGKIDYSRFVEQLLQFEMAQTAAPAAKKETVDEAKPKENKKAKGKKKK
ncbi:hypothetical protein BOX15_Mlig012370g1 [Macrostomum lignano]|uniref:EF-hand domain-containing protein n=1 Tax=Macrostomum lignano TaxID=282301 RepID=A0A267FXR1_9PLAT|nr:hypothetical protein BOX15_Mlig012370g1 [Macrostomum lignano]